MTRERFTDLVRVEQESIRRFLLAMCNGDADMADDIAQDALVRAYIASGSFLGLSKFSTWLYRIAYNCYIDHIRRSVPETISINTPQVLTIPSGDETDISFRHQNLYAALDSLPAKEKAVLVLHYFEDRSIKDIASIMKMPAGTVKYHLSTGRRHLKELLQ